MLQQQALVSPIGMEQEFTACGRVWRVSRRTLAVIEKFLQWLIPQVPDPFTGLDKIIDKLPPDQAHKLISEAKEQRDAVYDWDSEVVKRFLKTKRGQLHMFLFILQAYQPDATIDDAAAIGAELGEDKLCAILGVADGKPPSPKND